MLWRMEGRMGEGGTFPLNVQSCSIVVVGVSAVMKSAPVFVKLASVTEENVAVVSFS